MIHVVQKMCSHDGFSKWPSYALEGSGKGPVSFAHGNVKKGSTKTKFCAQHAAEGIMHVANRRCSHDGCSKQPTYGLMGTRKAEFCVQHALEGVDNVMAKRCPHNGCSSRPLYGLEGSSKRSSARSMPRWAW